MALSTPPQRKEKKHFFSLPHSTSSTLLTQLCGSTSPQYYLQKKIQHTGFKIRRYPFIVKPADEIVLNNLTCLDV